MSDSPLLNFRSLSNSVSQAFDHLGDAAAEAVQAATKTIDAATQADAELARTTRQKLEALITDTPAFAFVAAHPKALTLLMNASPRWAILAAGAGALALASWPSSADQSSATHRAHPAQGPVSDNPPPTVPVFADPAKPDFAYPEHPSEVRWHQAARAPRNEDALQWSTMPNFQASASDPADAATSANSASAAKAASSAADNTNEKKPSPLDEPFIDGMFRLTPQGSFTLVGKRYVRGTEDVISEPALDFKTLRGLLDQGWLTSIPRTFVQRWVESNLNPRAIDESKGRDDRIWAARWSAALTRLLQGTPDKPRSVNIWAPNVRELGQRNGMPGQRMFYRQGDVPAMVSMLQTGYAIAYATAQEQGREAYRFTVDFAAWLDYLAPRADGLPHLPAGQPAERVMLDKLQWLAQSRDASPKVGIFVYDMREADKAFSDETSNLRGDMKVWESLMDDASSTVAPALQQFLLKHHEARDRQFRFDTDLATLSYLNSVKLAFEHAGYQRGVDGLSEIVQNGNAAVHEMELHGMAFLRQRSLFSEFEAERSRRRAAIHENDLESYTEDLQKAEDDYAFKIGKQYADDLHEVLKPAVDKVKALIADASLFTCMVDSSL